MITVLAAWLLADLLSGIVHWMQDKLLDIETAFSGLYSVEADNFLHHVEPTAMLKCSIWENIKVSALTAWPLAAVLWFFDFHEILWLGIFFSAFGNAVHRFAHMPPSKVPRPIRWLQRAGLFCGPTIHLQHHYNKKGVILKEDSTQKYCVMTAYLNPILDGARVWYWMERVLK